MSPKNEEGGPVTDWPEAAVFVDPDTGGREHLAYVRGSAGALYTARSEPVAPIGIAVVMAPPVLMEFQRNYRRDALLARALSAAGVEAVRFCYRGQGHSAGDTSDLGFDSAVADTLSVVEGLGLDSGALTMMGTRLGGIVAAAAGSRLGVKRLIVADPVATGAAWVRELGRADRVQAMRQPDVDYVSLADRIERDGMADVLGFAVHPVLYEQAAQHTLESEMGATLESSLLVQFGRPDKISAPLAGLSEALGHRGVATTVTAVSEEEGWWASRRGDYFVSERVRPLAIELIAEVVDWVVAS